MWVLRGFASAIRRRVSSASIAVGWSSSRTTTIPGQYLIVRSRDRRHALIFETNGVKVVEIRGGLLPAAEYVEGCL
jgi:hypothetical protein